MIIVDIDCGVIESRMPIPEFPSTHKKKLMQNLKSLTRRKILMTDKLSVGRSEMFCDENDLSPDEIENEIKIVFLQSFSKILRRYRECLFFSKVDQPCFDAAAYLSHHIGESHPFISKFLRTQVFNEFCELHVENSNYFEDNYRYFVERGRNISKKLEVVIVDPPLTHYPEDEIEYCPENRCKGRKVI